MFDHFTRVVVATAIGLAGVLGIRGAVETHSVPARAALTSHGGSLYGAGWVQLVDALGGRCIDVRAQDGHRTPGARAQVWTCTDVPEQRWSRAPVPGDAASSTFTALRSGFCLDVRGAAPQPGAQVQQWPCTGTAGQRWIAAPDGELVSELTGQCLTALGEADEQGTMVVQQPCSGLASQRWRLAG